MDEEIYEVRFAILKPYEDNPDRCPRYMLHPETVDMVLKMSHGKASKDDLRSMLAGILKTRYELDHAVAHLTQVAEGIADMREGWLTWLLKLVKLM